MSQPAAVVYGEIPYEILLALGKLQERTSEILLEVGRMELSKSLLLEEARMLDKKFSTLLAQEAARMGIPQGTPWQMTPEGVAHAVPK